MSLWDRLLLRRRILSNGCWDYPINANNSGYVSVRLGDDSIGIHRYSAHINLGLDLSSSKLALHKCGNKRCWNPEHLYIGDRQDNMEDAIKARWVAHNATKAFCKRGHPFEGFNLRLTPQGNRRCRICARDKQRRIRARQKNERN